MAKKLRYSDIVGPYFYKIGLSDEDKDLVDLHFSASAHHIKRLAEATTQEDRYFHLTRHRAHQRKFMMIIYLRGDFTKAIDQSNQDLDRRGTWDPSITIMPDKNIYRCMLPNFRFRVGEAHCADIYLHEDDIEVVTQQAS